jgi:phosphoglucosamine mutase
MTKIKFGTDGVRGEWGNEVTAETGFRVAVAIGETFGGLSDLVLVQDTRNFNPELAEAVTAGAAINDIRVIDLGVLPTPAAALIAGRLSVVEDRPHAAISLSASHNPAHDAGIKVFGPGGKKLNDHMTSQIAASANQVRQTYKAGVTIAAGASDREIDRLRNSYINLLVGTVDEDLRYNRFLLGKTVVVDAANGAASWSAPEVLERLGANVQTINTKSSPGDVINDNCGATHPATMIEAVRRSGASYGLALDGDADRLMAFSADAQGERQLDGDDSIVIAVKSLMAKQWLVNRGVVVTAYSNLGLEQFMTDNSIKVLEVDNGDKYVLEGLIQTGYPIGGEQTGHTLYADVLNRSDLVLTGDGTLAALQHLQTESILGKPLHEISDWPVLPSQLTNIRLPKGVNAKDVLGRPEVLNAIKVANESISGGRVHVRGSGTEPVIRALVKGAEMGLVQDVSSQLERAIQEATS